MAVMSFNQRATLALTVFAEHAREQIEDDHWRDKRSSIKSMIG